MVERMPSFQVPKARRSKRLVLKRRASLVINLDRKPKRPPCLVLDSSKEGFRLRGSFDLRRGQVVELILDEEMPQPGALQRGLGRESWLQAGWRSRPENPVGDHSAVASALP